MIQNYWKDFLANTKRETGVKCAAVVCFGMDAKTCNGAVDRILSGDMGCRIYPANGYRKAMSGEAQAGELSIVADWQGVPCAVIETTNVRTMPVSELTDEICALEGIQPDLALWKEKQLPFIKTEIEELGGELLDSTLVTVEEFKLVYPVA